MSFTAATIICVTIACNIFTAAAATAAQKTEDAVRVNVYRGPTECDGSAEVRAGSVVGFHYTAIVDE